MRKIRFRAWDKIGNKIMRWNQLVKYNLSNVLINPDICGLQLMQYTGLKDKNGIEIYEGDIVVCREYEGYGGKIEWNNEDACFYFLIMNDDGKYEEEHIQEWVDEMEIIGNIYENPELLEVR